MCISLFNLEVVQKNQKVLAELELNTTMLAGLFNGSATTTASSSAPSSLPPLLENHSWFLGRPCVGGRFQQRF